MGHILTQDRGRNPDRIENIVRNLPKLRSRTMLVSPTQRLHRIENKLCREAAEAHMLFFKNIIFHEQMQLLAFSMKENNDKYKEKTLKL